MEEIGLKDIKRLIDAVFESKGIDFSNYAFSSFKRRITRFMETNKMRSSDELIGRIRSDNDFADLFVREITVNVTEMFRDPSFWIVLRDKVIPAISEKPQFNIWHAACSTGEEVFSMAILLKEAGKNKSASIIATDINKHVLEVASGGVFTLRSQETNSKNYEQFGGNGKLSDYFTVRDKMVQYDKKLIEKVTFKCHDLALDGPFSTFDLIICRNVLIYFNFELQEKVIHTFDQSLGKGSFLGIGSKEAITWCKSARSFEEFSFEEKIFRKITDSK